jgi:hypothetical protein
MLNAHISPVGLFFIIIIAVMLLLIGLMFSELMQVRHELRYMRDKLEKSTIGTVRNVATNEFVGDFDFKFKHLTPDELRN